MVGSDIFPDLQLTLAVGDDRRLVSELDLNSSTNERDGMLFEDSCVKTQQNQQKITIFYNGRLCVFDVTELQARSIISMAKTEMENLKPNNKMQNQISIDNNSPQDLQQLLNPGLSMKRSLQRFLLKRKTRINAASPYNVHKHQLSLSIKS